MRILLSMLVTLFLIGCDQAADQTGLATAEASKETFEWKLVTTWPKNYPGLGLAPENFAEKVEAMSGGRLKVKVFGAGQLVPAFEVFDAVSQGTAEMGHGASYYWTGKSKATAFFTSIPFGLNAQEMNGWLHYGGGLELWRELYNEFNFITKIFNHCYCDFLRKGINALVTHAVIASKHQGLRNFYFRSFITLPSCHKACVFFQLS